MYCETGDYYDTDKIVVFFCSISFGICTLTQVQSITNV